MKRIFLFLLAACIISLNAKANNIQLTNVSTVISGNNVMLEFDLSWENSWRVASTGNYDGAWVFFKFKDNDGKWKPIRFSGSNNTITSGYTITISNNGALTGVGAFIYRSANGSGAVALTNIRAGITPLPGTYDVRGFAIEMVYIPQGSYYLGDGSGTTNNFHTGSSPSNPFSVEGNNIQLGSGAGQLNSGLGFNGALSNNFPNGYNAFWMMKYEVSAGAYRDFANTLTLQQQNERLHVVGTAPAATEVFFFGRQQLEIVTSGINPSTPAVVGCDADNDNIYNEVNDGEWIALGGILWPDIAAYLDWAGLRPMTEMEFEKACRGNQTPLAGEYAWGNTQIYATVYTLSNSMRTNEAATNMSSNEGNAVYDLTQGSNASLRGGIFATTLSTRESAGSSYYGIMEMSGNVEEIAVSVSHPIGRDYTGKLGNGVLNDLGNADENYWPGMYGSQAAGIGRPYDGQYGVTEYFGLILRGGNCTSGAANLTVSRRGSLGVIASAGNQPYGIRGVRDAN